MSTNDTAARIIEAARACLLADGYAAMSTRKVADQAGVPLSQIHYHFGSKDDLILGLLRAENKGRLERQAEMYGQDLPLSEQWELACDFFGALGKLHQRPRDRPGAAIAAARKAGTRLLAIAVAQEFGGARLDDGREAQGLGRGLGPLTHITDFFIQIILNAKLLDFLDDQSGIG